MTLLATIAVFTMAIDVSQLAAALDHPDPARRSQAAEQLARLGPDAQSAAIAVVRALSDQAEEVRQWAAAALEEMGPPLATDLEALACLLSDENPDVGYWAATLLGRLGGEAAPAVDALGASLAADVACSVKERAAWALGEIGPPGKPAFAPLQHAAAGNNPRLARLARRAIDRIGD